MEQNEETAIQKNQESIRNLWDNFKCTYIKLIGVPEEKQEQEVEKLFEQIMKENFPNLVKEIDFQEVQEAQRVPNKLDPKRTTPRHIIIKMAKFKDKERILKQQEKSSQLLTGAYVRLSADFSKETLQARRDWQ